VKIMHVVLLLVALLLELSVLAACAVAAYRWPDGRVLATSLAVLAVLVMGLLWGRFAAPRARRPLTGMASVAFRTAWFGFGVLAIGWVLGPLAGFLLAAVCLVDAAGLHVLDREAVRR
jgi:hypothetical protein